MEMTKIILNQSVLLKVFFITFALLNRKAINSILMMSKQSKLGNLVVFTFTNSKIFKFAFQILSESQFLRNNQ